MQIAGEPSEETNAPTISPIIQQKRCIYDALSEVVTVVHYTPTEFDASKMYREGTLPDDAAMSMRAFSEALQSGEEVAIYRSFLNQKMLQATGMYPNPPFDINTPIEISAHDEEYLTRLEMLLFGYINGKAPVDKELKIIDLLEGDPLEVSFHTLEVWMACTSAAEILGAILHYRKCTAEASPRVALWRKTRRTFGMDDRKDLILALHTVQHVRRLSGIRTRRIMLHRLVECGNRIEALA